MLDVKTTMPTWSKSQQENGFRESSNSSIGPIKDHRAVYGDKTVGEVLNQVADPNWVDPKNVVRERKRDLDKDAFFKLMLTQMKNQDPFNPMQSHEMAAHLAQFTSMEQLFNVNENLENLKKIQSPAADFQTLNFIGRTISADSSRFARGKEDKSHELRFNVSSNMADVDIVIQDPEGTEVRKYSLHEVKKGPQKVTWNGLNEEGQKLGPGEYRFVVEGKDEHGKKQPIETAVKGLITGVNYTAQGPMLLIGDQSVYLKDVKKIEDDSLKEKQAAAESDLTAAPAPKKTQSAPVNTAPTNNLGNLKMAPELKNKVSGQKGGSES